MLKRDDLQEAGRQPPNPLAIRPPQNMKGVPGSTLFDFVPYEKNRDRDAGYQSPNQSEQIRRIHELVALYRCRFKQNASDAAVMGTLHSAASVIQIHFRYLKHLKDAGLLTKTAMTQKPVDQMP